MRSVAVRLLPVVPPGTNEAADSRTVFLPRDSAFRLVRNGGATWANPSEAVTDGEMLVYQSLDRARRQADAANVYGPIAADAVPLYGVAPNPPLEAVTGAVRVIADTVGRTRAARY